VTYEFISICQYHCFKKKDIAKVDKDAQFMIEDDFVQKEAIFDEIFKLKF